MATSGGLQAADGLDVANSATGANAIIVATLPGAAGKTTELAGFVVTAAGSTAGNAVTVVVAGVVGAPLNYTFTFPVGAVVGAQPLAVEFSPSLPASAANTPITVTVPAGGAGNTSASVAATGFQI